MSRSGGPRALAKKRWLLQVVAALTLQLVWFVLPEPSGAVIEPNPGAAADYATCSALFHAPGGDPDGVLLEDEAPGLHIAIVPESRQTSKTRYGDTARPVILWDPHYTGLIRGEDVGSDPCAELYHELSHVARDQARGSTLRDDCLLLSGPAVDSQIPIDEVEATQAENDYRRAHNLPVRTHYGPNQLPTPDQPCYAKPPVQSDNLYPREIDGSFALANSPSPFFTSGTVNFRAIQAGSCGTFAGCSYSIVSGEGYGHYASDKCDGEKAAPPWTTGDLPGLTLRFTDDPSAPGQYRFLDFSFGGDIFIPVVQCKDGQSFATAVLSGQSPTNPPPEWSPGQASLQFAIAPQDGRSGTVFLALSY